MKNKETNKETWVKKQKNKGGKMRRKGDEEKIENKQGLMVERIGVEMVRVRQSNRKGKIREGNKKRKAGNGNGKQRRWKS